MHGGEHPAYSMRIYNAGLTPHPFPDVIGSFNFFNALDMYNAVQSSISEEESLELQKNCDEVHKIYEKETTGYDYYPYK
jgi:hypothetical protein